MPIDPATGLDYVVHDGQRFILACLPSPDDFSGLARWGASNVTIPRDQWREVDFSHYNVPIRNQGSHGSCVGHGGACAFENVWGIQGGKDYRFSCCFLYGNINGGRDSGANISDACQSLIKTGVCLESEVPEGTIYKRHFPASVYTTAKRFMIAEAYHCQDFDEMCSAMQLGFIPCYGLRVGGDFGRLNSDGVAPVHRGMGNHCMFGRALKKLPNGQWAILNQNSWGTSWGIKGMCYLVEDHFFHGGNQPEVFVIQAIKPDPMDTDTPPILA